MNATNIHTVSVNTKRTSPINFGASSAPKHFCPEPPLRICWQVNSYNLFSQCVLGVSFAETTDNFFEYRLLGF